MAKRSLDFASINAAALAQYPDLLEQWVPGGRINGHEYVARNPTRSDDRPGSFKINTDTGVWSDFATGDSGSDPISLLAYIEGTDQGKAARRLSEILGTGDSPEANQREPQEKRQKQSSRPRWEALPRAPENAPAPPTEFRRKNPETGEWEGMPVVNRWAYVDASGGLIGYVCRFHPPEGGKDLIPCAWARDQDGHEAWRWLSFPKPRPLYGLAQLSARPQAQVIVVEGEKTADALQRLLPAVVVVTWPGGGKAVQYADWSPLAGRKVVLWPDADDPGKQTMEGWFDGGGRRRHGVAQLIEGQAEGIRVVEIEHDRPEGWDAADAEEEGWTTASTMGWIKQHLREPQAPWDYEDDEPDTDEEPPPLADDTPPPSNTMPGDVTDDAPFKPLGYDREQRYYYLSHGKRTVVDLTASGHTKTNLLQLAPLQWWEHTFPTKGGCAWDQAANALMQICHRLGPFDPSRIRGVGAWWDDGTPVIHLGDRVVVQGHEKELEDVASRYVYQVAPRLHGDLAQPLSGKEASKLIELTDMLAWEKPLHGKLYAGWLVVSIICGALHWRPHIWLTGRSGSGKSWVMENITHRLLGEVALFVQGNTSEAGLRQRLGSDARPVIFDEAESENARAGQRMQGILELARQASSENGAAILKGSAGGASAEFRVRSCFAFASVNVGVELEQDQSRICVLSLRKQRGEGAEQHFAQLQRRRAEILTDEWIARLHARAYRLIPQIRANAETFAAAGTEVLGLRRLGDQIGTMLAGAYALHRDGLITHEAAKKWLEGQDLTEEAQVTEQTDERMCLAHIMEHVVRVSGDSHQAERSIGDLIMVAQCRENDSDIHAQQAEDALARMGIKQTENFDGFIIAASHSMLERMLRDTPWHSQWARTIERLEGAERTSGPIRFGPGARSRGVVLPTRILTE